MNSRLLALALVAVALAPGTWLRSPLLPDNNAGLAITPVTDLPESVTASGFTREGVWELTSPNLNFGGFSALLLLGSGDRLRAFSDRGNMVTFDVPGRSTGSDPSFASVWNRGALSSSIPDIESATRNSVTGDYWLGFENGNAVIRYDRASRLLAVRQPPEWQGWPDNSGAEAMARLPDGRFLVLPEVRSAGLLYPGDPTQEGEPLRFTFTLPEDFFATDLAALPDGRVLVLLRKTTLAYPPFSAALGIADPRTLQDGGRLDVQVLVDLDLLIPHENYEALAIDPAPAGDAITLWLMSDDNLASFQRSLLARLRWQPDSAHEKAREE